LCHTIADIGSISVRTGLKPYQLQTEEKACVETVIVQCAPYKPKPVRVRFKS
jgi:hypothetical protein